MHDPHSAGGGANGADPADGGRNAATSARAWWCLARRTRRVQVMALTSGRGPARMARPRAARAAVTTAMIRGHGPGGELAEGGGVDEADGLAGDDTCDGREGVGRRFDGGTGTAAGRTGEGVVGDGGEGVGPVRPVRVVWLVLRPAGRQGGDPKAEPPRDDGLQEGSERGATCWRRVLSSCRRPVARFSSSPRTPGSPAGDICRRPLRCTE